MSAGQAVGARVVVIGLGNPFRGDDGAGIEVARRLRERLPAAIDVVEMDGDPVSLLDAWHDAQVAFVVDAVRADGPPGEVHRLEIGSGTDPLAPQRGHGSSHALGLGEAVELASVLGRLPARLTLIGISGTRFDLGDTITAPVLDALGGVVEALAEEVGSLCA